MQQSYELDWKMFIRPAIVAVVILGFVLGAILIYADNEAEKAVEAMYANKTFDTQGYGIYATATKGGWELIFQFRNSPPRLYKYEEFDPEFIELLVEIEDKRFWDHSGVDWIRVMSAAWHDLRHQELAQGASTLTQQFARQVVGLSRGKSFMRKMLEAFIARKIEARELVAVNGNKLESKKRIIAMYCSYMDLGFRHSQRVDGFIEASIAYFGKPLAQLTLGEYGLLIGMLKGTTAYGPHTEPEAAAKRRELIVDQWFEAGLIPEVGQEGKVVKTSAQVAAQAKREKIVVTPNSGLTQSFLVDQVFRELEYTGHGGTVGKVYTTYDLGVQAALNSALAEQMPAIHARYPGIQAAGVVLNWRTGGVLGMIGGTNYAQGYNRAFNTQAKRQPGSAFKPFVYAAALSKGYTPTSTVYDAPAGGFAPGNADGQYWGNISLSDALVFSRNPPAANTAQAIGLDYVREFATRCGLSEQPPDVTLALGSGSARVVDLASAYTAFPHGGRRAIPFTIGSITDGDNYSHGPVYMESMDSWVAASISGILVRAANEGTGKFLVSQFGLPSTIASKTGSSRDGWIVVFTPGGLLVCVYVGYDDPYRYDTGNLFGGNTAGRIAGAFLLSIANNPRYSGWFAGDFGPVARAASARPVYDRSPESSSPEPEKENDGSTPIIPQENTRPRRVLPESTPNA